MAKFALMSTEKRYPDALRFVIAHFYKTTWRRPEVRELEGLIRRYLEQGFCQTEAAKNVGRMQYLVTGFDDASYSFSLRWDSFVGKGHEEHLGRRYFHGLEVDPRKVVAIQRHTGDAIVAFRWLPFRAQARTMFAVTIAKDKTWRDYYPELRNRRRVHWLGNSHQRFNSGHGQDVVPPPY